jgi:hypothetical protein
MSTITHESPAVAVPEDQYGIDPFQAREMWAGLAIAVMWLAVALAAVFAPDIVSTSATSGTTIPSGVAVALFATIATRMVAKYGFGHRDGAAGGES